MPSLPIGVARLVLADLSRSRWYIHSSAYARWALCAGLHIPTIPPREGLLILFRTLREHDELRGESSS